MYYKYDVVSFIDVVRKWTCAIECSVWHFAIALIV